MSTEEHQDLDVEWCDEAFSAFRSGARHVDFHGFSSLSVAFLSFFFHFLYVSCDKGADLWPFKYADLERCGCEAGWLLQQLLKLYAPLLLDLSENVLVCDADVVWLKATRFLSEATALLCTFDSESCPPIRSAVDLQRYDGFVERMGFRKVRRKETAVCHHMVLRRDILKQLMEEAEEEI